MCAKIKTRQSQNLFAACKAMGIADGAQNLGGNIRPKPRNAQEVRILGKLKTGILKFVLNRFNLLPNLFQTVYCDLSLMEGGLSHSAADGIDRSPPNRSHPAFPSQRHSAWCYGTAEVIVFHASDCGRVQTFPHYR